ncbi:carbon-nitrogen hydrolase family protein [Photorhabdus laumondii subsp. laumondii]|uniref:Photorhabdus luminescens subsp. laumondii TTO1 complete genome segment 14/17 n=3 Tax=Photorhabdus laumondii TaxID=2218628 RepID=Q7N038_PHOLL|nr:MULTISPECIES: deaminated glutathione amidase [Photorhabdus]PQQ39197.1 carbon-nitrogen hydrolase family protein [Photorhabdus luminescens]AWK43644.1 amidohydrolase [Photorhabdus laumondii subsp. laumondii]AXG44326.1 carbon-nitrogen hydrolase family protein [Photorhabdus laumondii subsp. laumondii]AXG48955.1 carbon-nitrogen hydrolase family protein [Photorhabdus laumondii subsp. laumondii]MCC8385279.1 carbon-nitrogen hydrolase family protein [Photorhabdus laumondii]
MRNVNVALLQLCSGENIKHNLAQIEQQIKQLPDTIKFVMTPENALLFANADSYRRHAEQQGHGPLQQAVSEIARRYGVWLLIGSMPLISRENPERLTSSSLLFDDQGKICARYDKIHMFDVNINDEHGSYNESSVFQRGEHITVVDTPVGRLGMTICYDLRFPGLFQALREQGAELISVPAAFTRLTGKAHWEPLLRARAIENQCILLAPAQVGVHGTRQTWGHSMAVDGWGKVIKKNPDAVSALQLNVRADSLKIMREQMKVVKHNRFRPQLTSLIEKIPQIKE